MYWLQKLSHLSQGMSYNLEAHAAGILEVDWVRNYAASWTSCAMTLAHMYMWPMYICQLKVAAFCTLIEKSGSLCVKYAECTNIVRYVGQGVCCSRRVKWCCECDTIMQKNSCRCLLASSNELFSLNSAHTEETPTTCASHFVGSPHSLSAACRLLCRQTSTTS